MITYISESRFISLMKPKGKSKLEAERQQIRKMNILRYEDFDTLKLSKGHYVETNSDFIEDVKNIATIKQNLFGNLISFSQRELTDENCNEIDFKAKLHSDANMLNTNSIKEAQSVDSAFRCECGCNRAKGESVSFWAKDEDMEVLGPGTVLFFIFLKYVTASMVVIMLVYGIFALTTNLLGDTVDLSNCTSKYCVFRASSSDENKFNPRVMSTIQVYLGLFFSTVWIFMLRVIKYLGCNKNIMLDDRFKTASDYAIKIQNLPYGEYSEPQLIEYFQNLWERNESERVVVQTDTNEPQIFTDGSDDKGNKFRFKSIQIVYNMEFSRKMMDELASQCIMLYGMLKEDQSHQRNLVSNPVDYRYRKSRVKQTYELLQDLRKKFLNDADFRRNVSTTCTFIEFMDPKDKNHLLEHYGKEKISITKQIRAKVKNWCFPEKGDILFKGRVIEIERAPEPSDILWKNCEKKYSLSRKLVIYLITFLIILISFGIISGLNVLQDYISNNDITTDTTVLTTINIAMSLALMTTNSVLWFSLYYLLELEYNHTLTEKIISQMNKSLIASSINVIVLPIISSYVLLNKFYGTKGIAGVIFDYQFSLVTIGLAIRFIDPLNLIKKVILWVRCSRNFIIRFICARLPEISPEKGVKEVNRFYEGDYFDTADYYVTVIGAILHAMFYVTLVPAIIFLVTAMIFGFYWIYKFKILYRSNIPEMTDYLVFQTALSQAGFAPIIFGAGAMTTSFITSVVDPTRQFFYIAPALCIAIGIFGQLNPGGVMNKIVDFMMNRCFEQVEEKEEKGKQSETYYQDSNSLDLLGFQMVLLGGDPKLLTSELKAYCESFFKDFYNNEIRKMSFNLVHNMQKVNTTMTALKRFQHGEEEQHEDV